MDDMVVKYENIWKKYHWKLKKWKCNFDKYFSLAALEIVQRTNFHVNKDENFIKNMAILFYPLQWI